MKQLPHVAALLAHSRPAAHDKDDGQCDPNRHEPEQGIGWFVSGAGVAGFLAIVLVNSGCARLSVVRIGDHDDRATEGIRYYRPHPYLIISEMVPEKPEQTKGGDKTAKDTPSPTQSLQYKIVYLPDFDQEYAIQVRAGLGNVEFKPTIEQGGISQHSTPR